jgi:hypothetical protein
MLTAAYEYDRDKAAAFLSRAGQPAPDDLDSWVFLRISEDEQCAGYVWYGWLNGQDMMLHLYFAPEVRGRWNRRLLRAIHWLPALLGAKRLVAHEPSQKAADLARAAGWQPDGKGNWFVGLPCAWCV